MNRISPGISELYVANADGTNARLLLGNDTVYEYDAQWSPDGEWIVFSTERSGDGNTDVWRVLSDGSGLEEVAATPVSFNVLASRFPILDLLDANLE